jgi:mono/diheme cytochrome c family protein
MWPFPESKLTTWVIVTAIVITAIAMIIGFPDLRSRTGVLLNPDHAEMVVRGETIYMAHCASCHGRKLEGQPDWQTRDKDGFLPAPPHDESGHTWHHPDRLLFDITKRGVAAAANLDDYKTRMPAFGGTLNDTDIIAALSYIKSRWSEDLRQRHDALNRLQERRGSVE